MKWKSEPHRPTASDRTTTSPGPGSSGPGRSVTSIVLTACVTAARTRGSLVRARHFEQVADHHVLVLEAQVVGVRELLDALDLALAGVEELVEVEEREVDHARAEAVLGQQVRGAGLAEDRELHHVGDAVLGEQLRQQRDQVVEQVATPEV